MLKWALLLMRGENKLDTDTGHPHPTPNNQYLLSGIFLPASGPLCWIRYFSESPLEGKDPTGTSWERCWGSSRWKRERESPWESVSLCGRLVQVEIFLFSFLFFNGKFPFRELLDLARLKLCYSSPARCRNWPTVLWVFLQFDRALLFKVCFAKVAGYHLESVRNVESWPPLKC